MSQLKFIFRSDNSNVGDWWCPPWRYFPFKPGTVGDILDPNFEIKETDILLVGGGGLGNEFFRTHLNRIKASNPKVSILWGAGVDRVSKQGTVLSDEKYDLYGDYFDFFDEKGIRVFSNPQKFQYVPCASCMNNFLWKYREVKPSAKVGVYNHKRVPLFHAGNSNGIAVSDNSGEKFEDKIKFLSSFEYIITNTYHGVYWATLLGRKVICVPYKSGLFSFKFPPSYCFDGKIKDEHFDTAISYDHALEDCRKINLEYYFMLTNKYELV